MHEHLNEKNTPRQQSNRVAAIEHCPKPAMSWLRGEPFRICALIFLVSVVVRTVLALQMFASASGTPYLTGDANRYMESAVDLLARGWFTDRGVLSSYQGPGYTVFVALVVLLFGQSEEGVVGSQILLSAATACLVYAIARETSRNSNTHIPAAAAGLAAALNFGLVSFSVQIMSETLAVFLLVISVFFCLRLANRSNKCDLFLAALFLGLATLTRVAYYWYIVMLVLVLLVYRVTWRRVVAFICLYLVILAPWAIRNKIQFGEFMLARSSGHYLLFYFVPKVWGISGDELLLAYQRRTYAELSQAHNGVGSAVLDNYYANEYLEIAKSRLRQAGPWRVFRTWLRGMIQTVGAVYYSVYTHALGVEGLTIGNELVKTNIGNAILRVLAAAPGGVFRSLLLADLGLMLAQLASVLYVMVIDRSDWRRNIFLALSLAFFFTVGGIMSGSRPRVPLEPFFCLCVGFAIAHLARRFQYKTRGEALVST
jgi:4-amino-4-deoxy-L-arabinose transferase-like glycosyltransferase